MKAIGLVGPSGCGKTTLATQLIGHLREAGVLVSAIKHAGHGFEIDRPGTDSRRMAESGAFEVVIGSGRQMALVRQFAHEVDLRVQDLMGELVEPDDTTLWVVFEGFRHASHQKIEFWTGQDDRPALYPQDPFVVAIVTEVPDTLPQPTMLPVFRRDQAQEIAAFLLRDPDRFEVRP
jgi:molybdopterin-guanine dinucleotide biosynthesis adapter protein